MKPFYLVDKGAVFHFWMSGHKVLLPFTHNLQARICVYTCTKKNKDSL